MLECQTGIYLPSTARLKLTNMKIVSLLPILCLSLTIHAEDLHPAADAADFVPLFNGKDLAGWKTTGNWVVETDGSVSLHPREGEKGWQRYDA